MAAALGLTTADVIEQSILLQQAAETTMPIVYIGY